MIAWRRKLAKLAETSAVFLKNKERTKGQSAIFAVMVRLVCETL
jgi:hypothetical protein